MFDQRRVRLSLLFLAALAVALTQTPRSAKGRWYKGNLHTHTLNSDGDSTPHEVATWYREHGYQFLVLTDHNHLTDVFGLNAIHAATAFSANCEYLITNDNGFKRLSNINVITLDDLI